MTRRAICLLLLCLTSTAHAGAGWSPGGITFDSHASASNYGYFIDTTTAEGKVIFTMVLSAAAQSRGLWFGVPDGYAEGEVQYVGEW